ncbi:Regulator of MON1-CCZ1 complex [Frankliniella fusca]|uniref:Regulator of MON1-CCZ1 complex n=1 Tax=Frankliniella fusca TaxID=407009 RepID=A0AAE1LNK8_9NEOP|nr:Regulator of MON1-CCZ1 complex [Frankliniella fusca]
MDEGPDGYYLELSSSVVKFDSVSKVTNVFFDDTNKQVFAVRSGGVMGVVVKGPSPATSTDFCMEDKGPVVSIKFSPDQKVLAIQRSKSSVEFINFLSGEMDAVEYSQSCKGKNHVILGFLWTNNREILFVTDHGAELFQVIPEKKSLKAQKTFSLAINWFVYCPQTCLVLLSAGTLGNQMYPLHVKQGNINKLSRFDVDIPVVPKPPKLCLLERDITLAVLYGEASIIILRHNPRGTGSPGAEVMVYTLVKMMTAKKTHVLRLDLSGRFAINVVDNLIIVHHQASKKSLMFDIAMRGETDGMVTYHQPVVGLQPIKPFTLSLPPVPSPVHTEPTHINCELYSPNWVVFQPNIIIDAKLGCLWTIELNLQPLLTMIHDKCLLVDFLMKRTDSKPVVIQVLQEILEPTAQNCSHLVVVAELFDHLNEVYCSFLQSEMQSHIGTPASSLSVSPSKLPPLSPKPWIVIDQSDMYTNVFSKFVERSRECEEGNSGKFVVWVLLEYIRSLTDFHIPVQHYLYELLINSLVQHQAYYQLHQLLQYHVVSDSKPLACLLLSLESLYPAAHQLALDMLKRLSTANEEIIEVLLSKQQILPALRFVNSVGSVDQVSARKFLDAAKATDDPNVFIGVFKFFEQRNLRLKGTTAFAKGEHCDIYVKHYTTLSSEKSE